MKKIFLLFAFVGLFGTIQAQSPLKMVRKAKRLFGSYKLDPANSADKLAKAQEMMMEAFESDEVKADLKSNQALGDILMTVSQNQINAAVLDNTKMGDVDFGIVQKALGAFKTAQSLAKKKYQIKDALKGIGNLESILENAGLIALQSGKYEDAFKVLSSLLEASDILKVGGKTSILDQEVENNGKKYPKINDIISYALNAGAQPNVNVDISPMLNKAMDLNISDPTIYQVAYMKYKDSDKVKAAEYLNKGRELFPDDSGLLFAEINKYIEDENLEGLIEKLKMAIEKEPDNASVYSTLGNVYDQLFSKAKEEGNEEKATEYFDGALEYYKKSIEVEPKSFNSYYGIGALYFNKAAAVAKEMNEVSNDFSAAGVKKYQELEKQMKGYYNESFPYLQKAEELSPDDPLVLTALKEYYARIGDLTKSSEYKKRLEAMKK